MKKVFLTLTFAAIGATVALPALAQLTQPKARSTDTRQPQAAVSTPKTVALAAGRDSRAAAPLAALTVISAAGSLIVLADGIVANAAMAQIHPPAPGFVYEQ